MHALEPSLEALQKGRMIILIDDEDRENEGDLVIAAEHVTPEAINFMATHGRGLICLALPAERVEALELPLMPQRQNPRKTTAFTASIEARTGVTTGISAHDRARTIQVAIAPQTTASDLVSPGHVFPLKAAVGGVLVRAGHTEGSVDLARMAGLPGGAVICEIMKDDGTMARLPDLQEFASKHSLPIISIQDVIAHRMETECLIEHVATTRFPSEFSPSRDLELHAYRSLIDGTEHLAVVRGPVQEHSLVRVHSECLTGDALGSLRCDCGPQLHAALRQIAESESGVLVYMRRHEGRGIGLANKIRAYSLQDQGMDTVEANRHLGFQADLRQYGIGAQILRHLGVRRMDLLTNNPRKIVGLEGYGLTVVRRVPIEVGATSHNAGYLTTKREKLGHQLEIGKSS